jgi:hypothetical protein
VKANVIVSARTKNAKTGDVPTLAIGATREESLASCEAIRCPLLASGECYAQHGSVSWGHRSAIDKIQRKGIDATSPAAAIAAVAARAFSARMVRIGSIGDPSVARRDTLWAFVDEARRHGLAVVGYTHGWRRKVAADLHGTLMASCETLVDADKAVAKGWRATVVVPADAPRTMATPAGRKVVVCPAQVTDGRVQCNECRMCDASKPGPIVAFRAHGPKTRKLSERLAK